MAVMIFGAMFFSAIVLPPEVYLRYTGMLSENRVER